MFKVSCLLRPLQYWDALKLCMEQHIPMTEELVEKLTPSKEMEERDVEERNKILEGCLLYTSPSPRDS